MTMLLRKYKILKLKNSCTSVKNLFNIKKVKNPDYLTNTSSIR